MRGGSLTTPGIFWTLLSVQWGMFFSAFVFAFLYLWINLHQLAKNSAAFQRDGRNLDASAFLSRGEAVAPIGVLIFLPGLLNLGIVLVSAGAALLVAAGFSTEWDTYLRFRYGGAFGLSDPLFGVDVGFYLFHLPFYGLLQSSLMLLTVLTLAIVLPVDVFLGLLRASGNRQIEAGQNGTRHLSLLLFILVANWGWGFYLDHYELVYSTLGVVYGAGYAADHVTRTALWIMVGVSVVACAAALAFNFVRPRFKMLAVGGGVYVALWVIGVSLLPFFFQKSLLCSPVSYWHSKRPYSQKLHRLHAQGGLPAG